MTDKPTLKDVYIELDNAPMLDIEIDEGGNLVIDPQRAALAVEYEKAKSLQKIAEELGAIDQTLNSLLVIYTGTVAEKEKEQ